MAKFVVAASVLLLVMTTTSVLAEMEEPLIPAHQIACEDEVPFVRKTDGFVPYVIRRVKLCVITTKYLTHAVVTEMSDGPRLTGCLQEGWNPQSDSIPLAMLLGSCKYQLAEGHEDSYIPIPQSIDDWREQVEEYRDRFARWEEKPSQDWPKLDSLEQARKLVGRELRQGPQGTISYKDSLPEGS